MPSALLTTRKVGRPPGAGAQRSARRGGQAVAGIHHEQQRVGFGDGLLGLLGHFMDDAFLGDRIETGGIDHQKLALGDTPEAVARSRVRPESRRPARRGSW
jgi:hypothetical protein